MENTQIQIVQLPEISAKAYAEMNRIPIEYVNSQCRAGILPARKLKRNGICSDKDDRGTWFINLDELRQIISRNATA